MWQPTKYFECTFHVFEINWLPFAILCHRNGKIYVLYVPLPSSKHELDKLLPHFPFVGDRICLQHVHMNGDVMAVCSLADITIVASSTEEPRLSKAELHSKISESFFGRLANRGRRLSALDLLYVDYFYEFLFSSATGAQWNATIIEECLQSFIDNCMDNETDMLSDLDNQTLLMLCESFENSENCQSANNEIQSNKTIENDSSSNEKATEECECQLHFQDTISFIDLSIALSQSTEMGKSASRKNEYYVGVFSVCPYSGQFLLNDTKCIILRTTDNKNRIAVNSLIDKLVVVKKFYLIRPQESKDGWESVIIIDTIQNIFALTTTIHRSPSNILFIDNYNNKKEEIDTITAQFANKKKFPILSKSSIFVVKGGSLRYALFIMDNVGNKSCLLMTEKYISIYPRILTNRMYFLHYNRMPTKSNYSGFTYLQQQEIVDGVLELLPYNEEEEKKIKNWSIPVHNIDSLCNPSKHISKNLLVSVHGRIKNIYLTPSTSKRTEIYEKPHAGFGTPENRTPKITLANDDGTSSIHMYLNNWENHLYPIGLLTGALIEARNVYIQKNFQAYIKATQMTCIEIKDITP